MPIVRADCWRRSDHTPRSAEGARRGRVSAPSRSHPGRRTNRHQAKEVPDRGLTARWREGRADGKPSMRVGCARRGPIGSAGWQLRRGTKRRHRGRPGHPHRPERPAGQRRPQDQALVSLVEGFTAAARSQPRAALGHAQAVLAHADALGISHDCLRWAWPLAARAAHDLNDTVTAGELLTLLDNYQPGHLPPMLRTERDLAGARLAARDGDPDAAAAFTAAIASLREQSTPYHLAYGLLDYAGYLTRLPDAEAASLAAGEAQTIADGLRCQPLLDRAAGLTPAAPPVPAPTA